MNQDFCRDRPTLVTGATGLLGGWLTRALIARGAGLDRGLERTIGWYREVLAEGDSRQLSAHV